MNVGGENVGSGQVPRVTSPASALVESLRPLRIADEEGARPTAVPADQPRTPRISHKPEVPAAPRPVDEGLSQFQCLMTTAPQTLSDNIASQAPAEESSTRVSLSPGSAVPAKTGESPFCAQGG